MRNRNKPFKNNNNVNQTKNKNSLLETSNLSLDCAAERNTRQYQAPIPIQFFVWSSKDQSWTENTVYFELMFFVYLCLSFLCQLFYIYKTVWWYPTSLPASSNWANFHLIDFNLSTLVIEIFGFNLAYLLVFASYKPTNYKFLQACLRNCLCAVIVIVYIIDLFRNFALLSKFWDITKCLYLCYPFLVWFVGSWLFNGHPDLFEFRYCLRKGYSQLNKYWSDLQSVYESSLEKEDFKSVQIPAKIRDDVKMLQTSVNSKVCNVVLRAFLCSYFAGLVPILNTPKEHYIDTVWTLKHSTLVFLNCIVMLSLNTFNLTYSQVLSKTAILCGRFEKYDPTKSAIKKIIATSGENVSKSTSAKQSGSSDKSSHVLNDGSVTDIDIDDENENQINFMADDNSIVESEVSSTVEDKSSNSAVQDIHDVIEDEVFEMEEKEIVVCYYEWSSDIVYHKHDIVMHNQQLYIATGDHNTAEPGNRLHYNFYSYFLKPASSILITVPYILLLITMSYHISVFFTNSSMIRISSQGLLVLFSFLVSFTLLRDKRALQLEESYDYSNFVNNLDKDLCTNVVKHETKKKV